MAWTANIKRKTRKVHIIYFYKCQCFISYLRYVWISFDSDFGNYKTSISQQILNCKSNFNEKVVIFSSTVHLDCCTFFFFFWTANSDKKECSGRICQRFSISGKKVYFHSHVCLQRLRFILGSRQSQYIQ